MTDTAEKEGGKKKGTRFNPVELSRIHKESINKERKYESTNFKYDYTFQISSCKNNKILT